MDVLVVESPAKAKTIGKYLGPGFTVLASYGHVRDLPPKDGSVRPDEDFAMDWEVDAQSQKRIDAIAKAITKGGKLYLATDPDRGPGPAAERRPARFAIARARLSPPQPHRFGPVRRGHRDRGGCPFGLPDHRPKGSRTGTRGLCRAGVADGPSPRRIQ